MTGKTDYDEETDEPCPECGARGMSWWVVGAMCAAFGVIAVAVATVRAAP